MAASLRGARHVSDDEIFLAIASGYATIHAGILWYTPLVMSPQVRRAGFMFLLLALAPIIAFVGIIYALRTASSFDVQNSPQYLMLYGLLGLAYLFCAPLALRFAGISPRDDAVERRNPAAAIIILCTLMAHAAIYTGANIGDGPGWWTVVIAALIGSGAWALLWLLTEVSCGVSETITVERDIAAAIRLGGYGLAMGLICARGSAGDWSSLDQTLAEFTSAWPILPLAAAAIAVERGMRLVSGGASKTLSAIIALLYLGWACLAIYHAGPLPQNPLYVATP